MKRPRYQDYIQSPEWEKVRKRILKRARGKCEKCRKRPPLQVHHLTYARLGNERDEDLLAVCGPCHQSFHPDKQFLRPSFVGEHDCPMCPSETADIFAGNHEVLYICTGCGHTDRVNRKRKAKKPSPARPPKKKRPAKAQKPADPWEAARRKEAERERSLIGQGRKKLAAKGLKGFA
jgi:RNase P subunit RPR2